MYKLSIIIPIFNAEKTLKKTINNIINQSFGFDNIELILIDDKSTDKTIDIMKNYSKKYNNIKTILLDKNTGGPSIPRNKGIEKATADYLIFMDSDDEIFNDYCEVLYNKIINNNTDIVNCNDCRKLNKNYYISKSINTINTTEITVNNWDKLLFRHTAWGNIYRKSLIKDNHIRFPNTLHEDGFFSLKCLLSTKKPVIQLPNYPGYIYTIEDDESISHKISLNTFNKFIEGYELCEDLLKKNTPSHIIHEISSTYIKMAIFTLIKLNDIDKGIKRLYEFEETFDFNIILKSKPLNMINRKLIEGKFTQVKIILMIIKMLYYNKKIKNLIFIKYSNLKILNEN